MPNSFVLQALRRESVDVFNRLHSIAEDSEFVNSVHRFYPDTPVVPNLRCGAWYTDPAISSGISAYFKSTDGHFNNWSFNLRRPNLHLLQLAVEYCSLLLVDSTRAGKRIPDSLSKTVPIWCAVINRAMARRHPNLKAREWDTALYTPPGVVSPQEHHQIELQIDTWTDALLASSFDLPVLLAPLRPLWITPATTTFPSFASTGLAEPPFIPVICLSASKQSEDARRPGGFAYIQGSGDDHELWSMGLTPTEYWCHSTQLLTASRSELPRLIEALVSAAELDFGSRIKDKTVKGAQVTGITKVDGRMKICAFSELDSTVTKNTAYVLITVTVDASERLRASPDCSILKLHLTPLNKRYLTQTLLPRALPFIGEQLVQSRDVCIVCDSSGEGAICDEAVAVLLAALVLFFNTQGKMRETVSDTATTTMTTPADVDKARIRTCLEWVIACRPDVNPARGTLKRLNEFLLSRERQKASEHVKNGTTGPRP